MNPRMSPEERRARDTERLTQEAERELARERRKGKAPRTRLTDAASAGPAGVPACPHCGGVQFVPRRKTSTKVMFGVVSLVGRPKHVECVTCGELYTR